MVAMPAAAPTSIQAVVIVAAKPPLVLLTVPLVLPVVAIVPTIAAAVTITDIKQDSCG
jgi:hypothetical protein